MGEWLVPVLQDFIKHKATGKTLVDYMLVAQTAPMMITGSLFGVRICVK